MDKIVSRLKDVKESVNLKEGSRTATGTAEIDVNYLKNSPLLQKVVKKLLSEEAAMRKKLPELVGNDIEWKKCNNTLKECVNGKDLIGYRENEIKNLVRATQDIQELTENLEIAIKEAQKWPLEVEFQINSHDENAFNGNVYTKRLSEFNFASYKYDYTFKSHGDGFTQGAMSNKGIIIATDRWTEARFAFDIQPAESIRITEKSPNDNPPIEISTEERCRRKVVPETSQQN